MKQTQVQQGQEDDQRAGRKAGTAAESPQSEQIAQLEVMADRSPRLTRQANMKAMIDASHYVVGQRKLAEGIHSGTATLRRQEPSPAANNTGLPDNLKSGIESLSGIAMDQVKVHYNSSQPAQLNALAYAQGSDIHVAPGQERHLPHEAWHVVQQAQGRVKPTMQMKQGIPVNDDIPLEQEADVMGAKALQAAASDQVGPNAMRLAASSDTTVVSRRVDPDFATFRAGAVGAATKIEMQSFYDRVVHGEVVRLSDKNFEDDVKRAMMSADITFRMFMLNSTLPQIADKFDELIAAVNASADNYDAILDAPHTAAGEASYRKERVRREGSKHFVGTTKEMEFRGVQSPAEGRQLLVSLQAALTGALGAGFALGQVGVRGSAVTGIRTRNQQPFEQGTGQYQEASDASDHDYFFTCAPLEAQIRRTQHHLPEARRINEGGTMNAQYLNRWLNLGAPNGYAHAAALALALTTFSTNSLALTGRKSDVTFVGGNTAAGLAADPSTLIL